MSQFNIQDIINQLTAQRKQDLGRIEGLFDQFGVTARQDVGDAFTKARGSQAQDLISRGLSQTTKRATGRTDLLAQEQRAQQRIGEQVAGQKAGFLERQIVDPSLISNLIAQASAVNTNPVRAQLGATPGQASINAGTGFGSSGIIRPGGGGGGGGGATRGSSGIIRASGGGGGSAGTGARVIQSPRAELSTGGSAATGARTISAPRPAASTQAAGGGASLRSGQASGTGSISSTETGEGFETQTGQATPTAIPKDKKKEDEGRFFSPTQGFFISNRLRNRG